MVLHVQGMAKAFGGVQAVEDINIHVKAGEFVGLVGPNGAGKSTVLSIICGAQPADIGTVHICGEDILKTPVKARKNIAFVPDRPGVYQHLPCYDFLVFTAKNHGQDVSQILPNAQKTGCAHLLAKPMGELSRGQRQAVYLAAAFLVQPALMVLDEPTVGLDPMQQKSILSALRDFCKEGGAVLLSTHSLYEAEQVCDSLYVLMHQKIIAHGPAASLSQGHHNLFEFFETNTKMQGGAAC